MRWNPNKIERGGQVYASRRVRPQPQKTPPAAPGTSRTVTVDKTLVEAVARAIAVAECEPGEIRGHRLCTAAGCRFDRTMEPVESWGDQARAAIAAVHAWEARAL